MQTRNTFAATLLMALVGPLAAQASSSLASDQGCYNCHGSARRGAAPGFERLAAKLSKYKEAPADEPQFVDRFLAGKMGAHIDAHERVSPQAAKILIHWLAQGAK